MDEVRRSQAAWRIAPDHERPAARLQYLSALEKFNDLVLRGKLPA